MWSTHGPFLIAIIIKFPAKECAKAYSFARFMRGSDPMEAFRICPVGDQAVLCEFDNEINVQTNDRVQYLAVQIKAAHPKGVTEVLPTYRSLLIFYDQAITPRIGG